MPVKREKPCHFTIRLRREDHAEIVRRARAYKLTQSDYVVLMCLERAPGDAKSRLNFLEARLERLERAVSADPAAINPQALWNGR